MKKYAMVLMVFATTSLMASCSTIKGEKSSQNLSPTGPTVVSAESKPGTIELNSQLQPAVTPEIVAQIKDFTSPVKEAKVNFSQAPLSLPMTHVGGTTWVAKLNSDQLKMLAVGGQTIKYDANIVAKNEEGVTAVSHEPVTVIVKAPDLAPQLPG